MANFGPLTVEISLPIWAPQQILTGFASWFHYCSEVAHRRPTKLGTIFGRLLGWYTIHFWELLLLTEFCYVQNSLCVQVLRSRILDIGSVTARHSSSGPQPNFAAWYKKWNYGTFAEGATYIRLGGHHVGHRPTL